MTFHGLVVCFFVAIPCHRSVFSQNWKAIACSLALLAGMSPGCMAQGVVNPKEWGEKFNSPSASLVLKETGRTRSNGRTTVAYSIFASGLPKDAEYTLWTRLVGTEPQPAADALLNQDGRVVSQLADPEHHIAEDPIDLKVFAGRGEPKQFGLISNDGKFRAFGQVIPFPIEVSNGSCHISAVMMGADYAGISVGVAGLHPGEELLIDTQSDGEGRQSQVKATDQGTYNSAVFPFVKGKRSGELRFSVAAKSCKIALELPWGEGSYQLQ